MEKESPVLAGLSFLRCLKSINASALPRWRAGLAAVYLV